MVPNLDNIKKIFKKEFMTVLTDEETKLIMVGAIFLYGLFYLIPFHNQETRNLPIGVIDNDNSTLSREFTRDLNAHRNVNVVEYLYNIDDAKEEFYKNNIKGFILIPKDFEKDVKRGNPSNIAAYTDSSFLIIYKQIASAVGETANYFSNALEIGTLLKKGVNKDKALSIVAPIDFIQNPLYNPIGSYQNYIYPMILIIVLQQTMLIGIGMINGLQNEMMKGTKINEGGKIVYKKIDTISEYSKNSVEIVLGKACAYALLYFIYALMYFLLFPTFGVYDMSYNIIPMLMLLIPYLFACAFVGIGLTYFCPRREDVLILMIPTSVPFIFLPGFVWAKEAIPPLLHFISEFVPFEPAADGLVKVNQMGATFSQVLPDFWILIGLCIIYFLFANFTITKINNQKN